MDGSVTTRDSGLRLLGRASSPLVVSGVGPLLSGAGPSFVSWDLPSGWSPWGCRDSCRQILGRDEHVVRAGATPVCPCVSSPCSAFGVLPLGGPRVLPDWGPG